MSSKYNFNPNISKNSSSFLLTLFSSSMVSLLEEYVGFIEGTLFGCLGK